MVLKQKGAMVILLLSLFSLFGCEQSSDDKADGNTLVDYEYLSLDGEYSNEINNWLSKARNASDSHLHNLSLGNGKEYVYAKGYNQAKVSYTYEDFEGKINGSIKATLLKGEVSDEVLIEISYNTDVDVITLDVTDNKDQFYNEC